MRHWRKMTWALIAWSALILIWAIAGGAGSASESTRYCEQHSDAYFSQHACEQAHNAGTGIGVAAILFVGFCGFVFLSLIWFMTRPREARA